MDESLLDQVTLLSAASTGVMVGIITKLSPGLIVLVVGVKDIPVTFLSPSLTVITQVAVKPPSFVLAVIVAVPFLYCIDYAIFIN